MQMLRKGAAALLALLVVFTAVPAQILFNLDREIFSPAAYQRAFANDHFYERLPAILAGSLQPIIPVSLQGLDEQDWVQFFRDLLPPEVLQSMGDQAIGSALAYLNGESDTAVLLLTPMKERLAGDAGTLAAFNLLKTQPACTADELARITLALLTNQGISLCNPPGELMPMLQSVLHSQMQVIAAAIPESVSLAQAGNGMESDPREEIRLARLGMRLTPILPLSLLLLLTLFIVRNPRDLLLCWGAPLLAAGMLGAIFAWLGAPILGTLLERFFAERVPAFLPPILLSNASRLAASIVEEMLRPTLVQNLIMVFSGVVMMSLAALWGLPRQFRDPTPH